MPAQYIANGLVAGSFIALLALGFGLIYGGCRFFAFTYGASYVWAAYIQLVLKPRFGPILAMLGGVVGAVMVGILAESLLFIRLRRRSDGPLALMLVSIGAYIVLQNLVSVSFGDAARSIRGPTADRGIGFLGVFLGPAQIAMVICAAVVAGGMLLGLRFSIFGREVRAVVSDPELALVLGIDVDRIVLILVSLGSALGGLAAVVSSYDLALTPTMGFQAFLFAVAAAIVGGLRSFSGMVVGGMILGLIQQLAVWAFSAQWQDSAVFLVLIVFLLLKPDGLFGIRGATTSL